ncbi:immunoglobulin superfamily member 1-like [Podarcis raffonei]|uniref:immunoglobulin superfamily member 1-like n=1 Tax=Podarcis raffonei TaxID=65483 RepID=UPI0023294F4A|nr:immunoglobulin superfamily member 1-like [Podarcis raffonei]
MKFPSSILFLGCWLTRQWQISRGQLYRKPSISVRPSPQVILGEDFYIHCETENNSEATFFLVKEGSSAAVDSKTASYYTDFPLSNAKHVEPNGGFYKCKYCFNENKCSEFSDKVYVNIRGDLSPKPAIFVMPSPLIIPGTRFYIHCRNEYREQATFYLFKEGTPGHLFSSTDSFSTVFHIPNAKETDGGIYLCLYCFIQDQVKKCSGSSDRVYVNITEHFYPKPSISVSAHEIIALGGNATIHCKSEENPMAEFTLLREDSWGNHEIQKMEPGSILFPILNAKRTDGGIYFCTYCFQSDLDFNQRCSSYSDRVYINITDPWLSKPSITLTPTQQISTGMNVSIECQGAESYVTFSLLKSNNLIASQKAEENRNATKFFFSEVRLEDGGSYTCRYHRIGFPFRWSESSDPMELVVTANTSTSMEINIRLGVAGLVLLSLVLIVAEFMCSRAASQNIAGFQRQQPPAEIFTRETAELGANGRNCWLQKPSHEIPFQHPLSRLVSLLGGRWGQSVCKSRPGRLEARLPFLLLRYLDSKWILSFPGCWLSRQWQISRGQLHQKPSISVIPSPRVILGEKFYIRCENKLNSEATFYLVKEGSSAAVDSKTASYYTDFPLSNAKHVEPNGGVYKCKYCFTENTCSEFSNNVYVNVTGQLYRKPSISVSPSPLVIPGTQFFIHCRNEYREQATFYFSKEGTPGHLFSSTDSFSTVFHIPNAKETDGGIYLCSYCFIQDQVKKCSSSSDRVYINITEHFYPKPSISVSSHEIIALGGNATIRCKSEENPMAEFTLLREDSWGNREIKKMKPGSILFPILNAKRTDGGIYFCTYCFQSDLDFNQRCSNYSDRVYINITDPWLSKPSITLTPTQQISTGMNVSIECQGAKSYVTFSLLKSNNLIASQKAEENRNATKFFFSEVRLEDGGNYTCRYHRIGFPFRWSESSDPMELVVTASPKPSISVSPGEVIALEGNASIHCKTEKQQEAEFTLHIKNSSNTYESKKMGSGEVLFPIINAKESDGGIYRCRYCLNFKNTQACSNYSEEVHIKVTASPKPSISVSPGEGIALEGNASIHCKTKEQQEVEFTLHIENSSNTYESKMMGSGEVLFPIINAKESDGGIYRCRYCLKLENTQACSNYSDEVHIKVTGGNSKAGHSIAMWAGIAAGVFLLVLFLLTLAFVLSRKRKKGSVANERTQPANIPLQSEPEEDPDGVSYAVLSHSSLKTKPAPDADGIPESCTYATVAKGRTKEGQ